VYTIDAGVPRYHLCKLVLYAGIIIVQKQTKVGVTATTRTWWAIIDSWRKKIKMFCQHDRAAAHRMSGHKDKASAGHTETTQYRQMRTITALKDEPLYQYERHQRATTCCPVVDT
jgi:hypothetical protein